MAVPIRAHGVEVMQEESVLAIDAWIDRDIFFPGMSSPLLHLFVIYLFLVFSSRLMLCRRQYIIETEDQQYSLSI